MNTMSRGLKVKKRRRIGIRALTWSSVPAVTRVCLRSTSHFQQRVSTVESEMNFPSKLLLQIIDVVCHVSDLQLTSR